MKHKEEIFFYSIVAVGVALVVSYFIYWWSNARGTCSYFDWVRMNCHAASALVTSSEIANPIDLSLSYPGGQ